MKGISSFEPQSIHVGMQARAVIQILSKNFLWMRTLGSTPMLERENRERFSERVSNMSTKLDACDVQLSHGMAGRFGGACHHKTLSACIVLF